ncbi:MAG TPA: hypothetical protein VGL77_18260 [Armatimonadota bacterium]|jgi:hypothetical protein
MIRWLLVCCLCGLMLPALAAVEIAGLPDQLGEEYDVTWTLTVQTPTAAPLLCDVASTARHFTLRLDMRGASWLQDATVLASAPLALQRDTRYTITFKRRAQTMALLVDHRLVCCAPAPSMPKERLTFRALPAGLQVSDARYLGVEPHYFGDDFMRPEAPHSTTEQPWVEDQSWRVAYYQKDNPAGSLRDAKTGKTLANPWQLSIFYNTKTSTNGFWMLYTGTGPSWIVSNPTMVTPSWDRYFVEAAVRPEYGSVIGLIAAYQDNRNYLLFRWKPRDYLDKETGPHAELLAVVDGKERLLASDTRAFDPGQWYQLRLNVSWQRLEVLVDGVTLLAAANSGPVEGRIGLYANGAEHPSRPKLDEATATMYIATDEQSGKVMNDAAEAMRTTSVIYFDDVRVGDWVGIDDLRTSPYPVEQSGSWTVNANGWQARAAGRLVTGANSWTRYTMTARIQVPPSGAAGLLLHMNAEQTGFGWLLSAQGQRLTPLTRNVWQTSVDSSASGLAPGSWADLRVEADGPYLACYCNGERVLEAYDPTRASGRCGLITTAAGASFSTVAVRPMAVPQATAKVHDGFDANGWMISWSSPEANWYPVVMHGVYLRMPATNGKPADAGPAGPLMTNVPGLYWHKGGFYHDLRVTLPIMPGNINGQQLHLATSYAPTSGYRVQLTTQGGKGQATLLRGATAVGTYPFTLADHTQLVFERRGASLILRAQTLDPDDKSDTPDITHEELLFTYHDQQPLHAEMLGYTVTDPAMPAAALQVDSDRLQDTFERSPVGWVAQSGIWAVMARYSCQPQWNWYGGFGSGAPTVWNKMLLEGDQNIEVYLGIKMQYANMTESEQQRFRDMNLSFCADGAHLNSGYTVIRGGRQNGQPMTMLLRKNVIVQSTNTPANLIPGGGHRQWFATRVEKRGGEIKVFLDNHLALTYVDPDPLPGGYAAFWTLDNGIMIGRANLSAEHMSIGTPLAAAPLVVQEGLPARPSPTALLNGQPVTLHNFEAGLDGWQARPGFSGALGRERVTDPQRTNTYLKIVNSFPAGDVSALVTKNRVDLTATPILYFNYNFDAAAKVNLYVNYRQVWYEFLLTGEEATEDVRTGGRIAATADGAWHHLHTDLGAMLSDAVTRDTGVAPTDLTAEQIIVADWSAAPDLRRYGFGQTPGGAAIRFDNFGFLPRFTGTPTVTWIAPK